MEASNAGGSKLLGQELILSGSVQSLPDFAGYRLLNVTIQAKTTNSGVVYLTDYAGVNRVAQVAVGGSISIDLVATTAYKVLGTANDQVYIMAVVQ